MSALCTDASHGAVVLTAANTFPRSGGHIQMQGICQTCGLPRGTTINDEQMTPLLTEMLATAQEHGIQFSCVFPARGSDHGSHIPLCACEPVPK